MRRLLVFWVLFSNTQYVGVQAQSAVWKFPTADNPLQANRGDTLLLDYTSTFNDTILRMWCTPRGGSRRRVSSFYVNFDGPFSYVLATYAPSETGFPLICHGELASEPLRHGVNSPAGITFSFNAAQAAKTILPSQAAISNIATTTLTGPTVSITASNQGATTTNSLSQPITYEPFIAPSSRSIPLEPLISPVGSSLPHPIITDPLISPSGVAATSQSSATLSTFSSPFVAPSSSSNTGAIVGGVIGSLALVSLIVFSLLFLRKHGRNHTSPATEHSKPGFSLLSFYQKRGGKLSTANVYEKEGDTGVRFHEKDGNCLPHPRQVIQAPGSRVAFELEAGSTNLP